MFSVHKNQTKDQTKSQKLILPFSYSRKNTKNIKPTTIQCGTIIWKVMYTITPCNKNHTIATQKAITFQEANHEFSKLLFIGHNSDKLVKKEFWWIFHWMNINCVCHRVYFQNDSITEFYQSRNNCEILWEISSKIFIYFFHNGTFLFLAPPQKIE